MPELPEVETTIRYLKPALLGQEIIAVKFGPKASSIFNMPIDAVSQRLIGHKVISLERHGKFMLFSFDNDLKVVGHLRMSGRYLIDNGELTHPHKHFSLAMASGSQVHYVDQRRFGTFHIVDDFNSYPGLQKLGVDALKDKLEFAEIKQRLKKRQIGIYTALIDQSIIAGLGNIYVNEVLFRARIHPLRKSKSLSDQEIHNILEQIKPILEQALRLKGTTLIDNLYQDPEGKTGEFIKLLNVYGRTGQTCNICGETITRIKIGGRSVFVCNNCQH